MKHVSCSCGYVASGKTGDELLSAVEAHIAASHGAGSRGVDEAIDAGPEAHTKAGGAPGHETKGKR